MPHAVEYYVPTGVALILGLMALGLSFPIFEFSYFMWTMPPKREDLFPILGIGALALVLSAFPLYFAFGYLRTVYPKPMLRLDARGITFFESSGNRLVPWNQVGAAKIVLHQGKNATRSLDLEIKGGKVCSVPFVIDLEDLHAKIIQFQKIYGSCENTAAPDLPVKQRVQRVGVSKWVHGFIEIIDFVSMFLG
jgi:hypothetical protein